VKIKPKIEIKCFANAVWLAVQKQAPEPNGMPSYFILQNVI
jgi:hypothetical protein